MEFGLTIWLKCYTNAQYTVVSTMLKDLAFRILGIIMLYFNLGVKDYISADHHEPARHAAGWAGMVVTSLSAIDAALRPKHAKLRIFDELSILSIYVCIWALFFSIFEEISILFMCICGASIFVGLFDFLHKRSLGVVIEPPKPNNAVTSLLRVMKNEPKEGTQYLLAATLVLAVIDPDNPSTMALVDEMKKRYEAAASV